MVADPASLKPGPGRRGAWLEGGRSGPPHGHPGLRVRRAESGVPSAASAGAGHPEPGLETHSLQRPRASTSWASGGPGWEAASSRGLHCHPGPLLGHSHHLPADKRCVAVEWKPLKQLQFSVRGGRRVSGLPPPALSSTTPTADPLAVFPTCLAGLVPPRAFPLGGPQGPLSQCRLPWERAERGGAALKSFLGRGRRADCHGGGGRRVSGAVGRRVSADFAFQTWACPRTSRRSWPADSPPGTAAARGTPASAAPRTQVSGAGRGGVSRGAVEQRGARAARWGRPCLLAFQGSVPQFPPPGSPQFPSL